MKLTKYDCYYDLPEKTVTRLWIDGCLKSNDCDVLCVDCFREVAECDYKAIRKDVL